MRLIIFLCLLLPFIKSNAQETAFFPGRPKLVVGIVVDQMRQEYIYRYKHKFGKGGFNRLIDGGYMLTNAHYNYVPTYTGPGHASIYTGTTPAVHGIIGNEWYDKLLKKSVNCVMDPNQKIVGSQAGNGDVSPWRLLTTTVTDELELATQRRSKVIGISIKDRGAVLPAGHTPDGAYWYDDLTGNFISSTFYKPALPIWLEKFNAQKLADKYLNETWNTVYPIDQYKESGPDDNPYESVLTYGRTIKGKDKPVFPYNLKELRKENGEYSLLPATPFGNDLLNDLALVAIDGEEMGKDEWTDFLAISYSSTDILGHSVGPNSIEIEDTYIRLDKNLEALFKKLDATVGKDQYLVFLTADHGVADIRQYLMDLNVLPRSYQPIKFKEEIDNHLKQYFPGKELVEDVSNGQVFLNHAIFEGDLKSAGVEYMVVSETIKSFLLSLEGVRDVYTRSEIQSTGFDENSLRGNIKRGIHQKRSGDIAFVMEPGWTGVSATHTTTHGAGYSYDTHVPMLFYGFGVKQGKSATYHPITDIAPTVSTILQIKFPNGCNGQPIGELLR